VPGSDTHGALNIGSEGKHRRLRSVGLHLHDTMAFNTLGTPLGLVDIQVWAREAERYDQAESRHERCIEDKESYKWLKSYEAASEVQLRCPETLVVSVGDRESDIYELFELAHKTEGGAKLLVRGNSARVLTDDKKLWDLYIPAVPRLGK